MAKLVIIRGNSGSGKSTLAKELRCRMEGKTALIEQDYLRRIVLKEKERDGGDNIALITQTARFSLNHGYNVILEGILSYPRYGEMLKQLVSLCPDSHVYYMDVSFEETLKRHGTKPNRHEFGEKEMRDWYREGDLTGFPQEKIIPQSYSLEQSLQEILGDIGEKPV